MDFKSKVEIQLRDLRDLAIELATMAVLGEEESEVEGRQKAKESILARLTASEPKSVSEEGTGEKP